MRELISTVVVMAFAFMLVLSSTNPCTSFASFFDGDTIRDEEFKWDFSKVEEWADLAQNDQGLVELIIGLGNTHSGHCVQLENIIRKYHGDIIDPVSLAELRALVAEIPVSLVSSFVREMRCEGLSRYIEPNFEIQLHFEPDDPEWTEQWGPRKIKANYAWNTTIGNKSILVAVIDTGVDYNHNDLGANYVPLGYDWVNEDSDPMDDHGHGTLCTGIIAAVINNSIGIAGLGQVKIMAEKILDLFGVGYVVEAAKGIIHAVNQSADVLSCSWGGFYSSTVLKEAVQYAYDHGVVMVASAGNEASTVRIYPAAYNEVIAVSATDQNDNLAPFSSYGEWIDVAAPGVDILSTLPDDSYWNGSGTSMACPHVSGVVALILSQFPEMAHDQVRVQLRYNADDLQPSGFDLKYGYGRINAKKAVEQAPPTHDLTIVYWKKPSKVALGHGTTIKSAVHNFGTRNETNVSVRFYVNKNLVDTQIVDFIQSGRTTFVNFLWTPTEEGIYNITSYVVPVSGETIKIDNTRSANVTVRLKRLLFVPTEYSTIQGAVDAANSGDTVVVEGGVYNETITVSKTLSLVGLNDPVINARGDSDAVAISADNVEFVGFTVKNASDFGIGLFTSQNSTIMGNTVRNCSIALFVDDCIQSVIFGNTLANSTFGFWMWFSELNTIIGNTIANNTYGIYLVSSQYNRFYHNNIEHNQQQVQRSSHKNEWDNGYPGGGNYWSDYSGQDQYHGPYQNETGSDGIGDTPYIISSEHQDKYPLMSPWTIRLPMPGGLNNFGFEERGGSVSEATNWNATSGWRELRGDINADSLIDIVDVVTVATAFGSRPGDPNWDTRCDLNGEGLIDIVDVVMVAIEFGFSTLRMQGAYSWYTGTPANQTFTMNQTIHEVEDLEGRTIKFSFFFHPNATLPNGSINNARAKIQYIDSTGEHWKVGDWIKPTQRDWYQATVTATLPDTTSTVQVWIEGTTNFIAHIDQATLSITG